ncbi:MAG: DUF5365 family protein [Bacillota bacterium]|nr:DUF5365 family protein [Bacillota bacterium]
MKIVFASTPGQTEHIAELVRHLYSNVFPMYFADDDIKEFEQLKVLETSSQYFNDINTLQDAFQVMTCLQTIISILECGVLYENYIKLFNINAEIIQKSGLFFPFEFEQFLESKTLKKCIFSTYTKAANELLI